MEREEKWNQFLMTGSVKDYLAYRCACEADKKTPYNGQELTDARDSRSDRNRTGDFPGIRV